MRFFKVLDVRGTLCIGMFAKRAIGPGDEITFDYKYGTRKYALVPKSNDMTVWRAAQHTFIQTYIYISYMCVHIYPFQL